MVRREIVLVAMFVITMMIFEDHDDGRDIDDQERKKHAKKSCDKKSKKRHCLKKKKSLL